MSERSEHVPELPVSRNAGLGRHVYDHPAYRLFPGINPVLPILIDNEQQDLIAQQLTSLDPDTAVDLVADVSRISRIDRDNWERENLRPLGVRALYDYADLAGDPLSIFEMIEMFGHATVSAHTEVHQLLDEAGTVQRQSTIGDIKGVTIAAGTADQNGDWQRSEFLDYAMDLAFSRVEESSKYGLTLHSPDHIRRHNIKLLTEHGVMQSSGDVANHIGSRIVGLYVIRERAVADVNPFYGHRRKKKDRAAFRDQLQIIKRSESIVIPSPEMLMHVIGSVASKGSIKIVTGAAMNSVIAPFIDRYEELIHRDHSSLVYGDDMDITPIAMTMLIRNRLAGRV